jgi:phosphate transport system substrate-binding protein
VVDLMKAYASYVISEEGQAASQANAGNAPISADLRAKAEAVIAAIQ